MSTKNKLYILGDSFCDGGDTFEDTQYCWYYFLEESLKETHELVLDSFGSRDTQTMIDNWIKFIPRMTKDDIIIICFPTLIRIRLPLHEKDYMFNEIDDNFKITNRFITHHAWYLNDNEFIYVNDTKIPYDILNERTVFFEGLMHENSAVEKNFNEVVESLYKITPAQKYLFSWDIMKHKSSVIEYKDDITNKIGWSTRAELYDETNGEWGGKEDFHWDYRFEQKFGNYMIEKFKK